MSAKVDNGIIAPAELRLMLLAYGLNHPYRVVNLDEISHAIEYVDRDRTREALELLAEEGLLTRFSGRYCFNRVIPTDLRRIVEKAISPSGTIRVERSA
jgi:hypothetical protein